MLLANCKGAEKNFTTNHTNFMFDFFFILSNDYWKPTIEPASQEEIEMINERMKDFENDPSSFSPLKF